MAGEQIVGFLQLLEQGAVTSNDGTGWCSFWLNLLEIILGGSIADRGLPKKVEADGLPGDDVLSF